MASQHKELTKAKNSKKDEFYTQLADIERELKHYKDHFRGKVVLCNCDDPMVSGFCRYFSLNFQKLGLKKLIATCYRSQETSQFSQNDSEQAIWLSYPNSDDDPEFGEIFLKGNGDFRSEESINLLRQADIVVTNPPFSLFREYVAQLIEHDKKFLIIGNTNAITYKDIFPLIKDNRLWLGCTNFNVGMFFEVPTDWEHFHHIEKDTGKKMARVSTSCWFTNLDIAKHHEDLLLYKTYTPEEYPKYDNYDAIEVSKVAEIPVDYDGVMGVPITFLDKHNPDQFDILGTTDRGDSGLRNKKYTKKDAVNPGVLNSCGTIKIGEEFRPTYKRLLIKRRQS